MVSLNMHSIAVITVFIIGVIPKRGGRSFPLDGCSTEEMDLLFLFINDDEKLVSQNNVYLEFTKDLLHYPYNKTRPRLLHASVIDRLSASNHSANFSSWTLLTYFMPVPYGLKLEYFRKLHFKNARDVIEKKVTLVQRLFSEMSGVRENVTHVAVVFLDGRDLSNDDIRNIPLIVQQQSTNINIFVVVLGWEGTVDTAYLSGTLLAGRSGLSNHVLTMAMCNQCMEGWSMFEHSHGADAVSCYKLVDLTFLIHRITAQEKCLQMYSGYLATIETHEEMRFLKSIIYPYIKGLSNTRYAMFNKTQFSIQIHIDLQRDSTNVAKRFQWAHPTRPRPLLLNNWLPGKPSGGHINGCAVWQFDWSVDDSNINNVSSNEAHVIDGWADVFCRTRISSLCLCEESLPRKAEIMGLLILNLATNDTISRALTKGQFINYGGNIVSISANIANNNFLKFLRETTREIFPLFDCGEYAENPRYISYSFLCDQIYHCSNRRDEAACRIANSEDVSSKYSQGDCTERCNGVYCCDGSCLQPQWVLDGEVDCKVCEPKTDTDDDDESGVFFDYVKRIDGCAFFCDCGKCVRFSQLNDGHDDCRGQEGHLDETLGKLETVDTCHNLGVHRIWAPLCVYIKDLYGAVLGCRDMSHLKDCSGFECPEGYVKCPNTYCIPQHYVLDGHVDCPTGEDELSFNVGSCTGSFACWDSKICLYPDLVCDGRPDCPHRDDELECNVLCDDGFQCMAGTVTLINCSKQFDSHTLDFLSDRTTYLDLTGADLSEWVFTQKEDHLIVLVWSHCKIRSLYPMFEDTFRSVQSLDVSYNLIHTLGSCDIYFSALENLRHLNLSYNRELVVMEDLQFNYLEILDLSNTGLSYIDQSLLQGLPKLKHLDLSYSLMLSLHKTILSADVSLNVLDLRGLRIDTIYGGFFDGISIKEHLYTDRFQLCCPQIRGANIPYYACHAPGDDISSCFDLVGANVQRVLLWVVAALAVLGNMAVIAYRLVWERSTLRTSYGLLVTNLGIADLIMGVYLFIIAGAGYYYRGMYVLYDTTWRESIVCRLGGLLATLSSETSAFFIFLITLDRFILMKYPFGQVQFSKLARKLAIIMSWIIGLLLALPPLVLRCEISSSNALCLGLPLTRERLSGWEYSFAVFIVLNMCLCLVTGVGQIAVFRAMSENRIIGATSLSPSRLQEDIRIAQKLSMVVIFNFLCWFPVGFMGLLSFGGHDIGNEVYAWTAIIVLPINSAVNPLLYTIPALLIRLHQCKSVEAGSR